MSRRDRDLVRAQRLLRRVDLEEVLEALGLDVLHYKGADAYTECPDPVHDDENPSFHVCVEDVQDRDGADRLGAFNCWSHPGDDGLAGANFLDLAARVLRGIWGEGEDGEPRFPREADRDFAAAWIRRNFLSGEVDFERLERRSVRRRRREDRGDRRLVWPPCAPVGEADARFEVYLSRRGITPERAAELDVRAVPRAGRDLRMLEETVPGVLFPIRWDGEVVNWFVRSISRHCPKRAKGRYAPVKLGRAGVLWAPDEPDLRAPAALVEGVFDAERVRRLLLRHPDLPVPHRNVFAVLGGRIVPEQCARLYAHPLIIHLADGDAGGKTLSESILEHLGERTSVLIRGLPEGTDPDDAPDEALLEALRIPPPRETARSRRYRRTAR